MRTKSQAIGVMFVGVVTSAALVSMALLGGSGEPGRPVSAATRIVGVGLAIVALLVTARLARCAAIVRTDGVLIRNPIRTEFLAWSSITTFRVGRHGVWPRIGVASCTNRPDVAIWAIQGRGPALAKSKRDPVLALVQQLNEARAQALGEQS